MKTDKRAILLITLFYLLNIINTYFITTSALNRYLVSFSRSFVMEINAFIGNFAVLTIILFLGFMIFKKRKRRHLYIVFFTFFLNILVFLMGLFSKYYQTVFSFNSFDIFKNPAGALTASIVIESLKELIVYYRIVVFVPFIVLLGLYLYFKYSKTKDYYKEEAIIFNSIQLNFSMILLGMLLSISSLTFLQSKMKEQWQLDAEKPLFAVQNGGVYNYYFGELFNYNYEEIKEINYDKYDSYNKNKATYNSYFNEDNFSNKLKIADANNLEIDSSLLKDEYLNGVLKDKNIILVHVESFNHFLLDEEGILDDTYLKTLKELLKESYVFENFYTNVGVGNSSDAEFSVLTGILPKGDNTIYWEYENDNYNFQSLPKLFPNYNKKVLHGDVGEFYNRIVIMDEMMGFDKYYYYNEKEKDYEGTSNSYHLFKNLNVKTDPESPWVSDMSLFDWTKRVFDKDERNFLFPIMIQPHVPFLYYEENPRFDKELKVDLTTLRYLNYESYFESFFSKFIEDAAYFENSAFIFYGDHGSSVPYKDLLEIKGKTKEEFSILEYEKEMLRTLAFIYVPGEEKNEAGVYQGLLKGRQPLVRSQIDLYRTIVELYGLNTKHYYFGVNGLSKEKTFAVDTRTFSLVTDEYYLVGKRMNEIKELNKDTIYPLKDSYQYNPYEFFKYAMEFKFEMDNALKKNYFYLLKNN